MFYLKLTDTHAKSMMIEGLASLFGGDTNSFKQYTEFIVDENTGDKYWLVKNMEKHGTYYDVEKYVIKNIPTLPRYTHEFVSKFLPHHTV